jgi:hypothetical protein
MGLYYADPGERDLGKETRESLQAQVDIAPGRYASEAQYRPLYDQLELGSLNTALMGGGGQPGLLDTYFQQIAPRAAATEREAAAAQRAADIGAVEQLGPRATAAMRAVNPQQTALLDAITQQATSGVEAGYNLPPGLQDVVSQSTRTGQAARGLGFGPADAYAETLAQSEAANQWRGQNIDQGMRAAQLNAVTQSDPFLAILGRPASTPAAAMGLLGQGQGLGGQSQSVYGRFDPMNAYSQDLFNTNYNAQAAQKIASGNAYTGIISSAVGAL